ncbi:ABC transporter substrate-binding protein [bacterium]|nr:MAG: ABC transporter substrate-binding protein [bacterium]
MRRSLIKSAALVLLGSVLLLGFNMSLQSSPDQTSINRTNDPVTGEKDRYRIISLAPSITEILFALELGQNVVGVTRYCDYPPQAAEKMKVGGYFDINYEAILTAEPDLVVLLKEHEQPRNYLERLNIETLTVDHSNVQGIIRSIVHIAEKTDTVSRSERIVSDLKERIDSISKLIGELERPRVMVAVGRNMETGVAGEVYVSGQDGFYDSLITLAGGENAYGHSTLKFPALSAEGVARLNPQVIIEMAPDIDDGKMASQILDQWRSIPGVEAVGNERIYLFSEDYAVVPGPRFILLLEWMARVIHPDAGWD